MQTPESSMQPTDAIAVEATPVHAACQKSAAAQRVRCGRRRLVVVLACLAGLVITPLCGFFYLSITKQRELEAVIAEIERDDPRWQFEDVLADRPRIPDSDNPAIVVASVAAMGVAYFDLGRQYDRLFEGEMDMVHQLNGPQIEAIRPALEKHPEALKLARSLKDFTGEGRYAIRWTPPYVYSNLDPLQRSRGVGYFLQNDAMLRAHDEDADGAMESCRAILVTARAVGDEPCLIAALIRTAEGMLAINALERVLGQTEPSAAQLVAMQHLLEREVEAPVLYWAMRGERGSLNGMIDGVENGSVKLSALSSTPNGAMKNFIMDHAPIMVTHGRADALRLVNQAVAATRLPVEKQQEAFAQIERAVPTSSAIAMLLVPALGKIAEAYRRHQSHLRCAAAALAAERYRLQHHRWPASLDTLVKDGFLAAVSVDAFDGAPMRLSAGADGIVIYSVGVDGIDNGGTISRQRPRDPGVDLGFRLWNPESRRQAPLPPPALDN
jgi:hypothetical protein